MKELIQIAVIALIGMALATGCTYLVFVYTPPSNAAVSAYPAPTTSVPVQGVPTPTTQPIIEINETFYVYLPYVKGGTQQ